jgi:hypothetical protein
MTFIAHFSGGPLHGQIRAEATDEVAVFAVTLDMPKPGSATPVDPDQVVKLIHHAYIREMASVQLDDQTHTYYHYAGEVPHADPS